MKNNKNKLDIVYKEALIYCRVSTLNQENDGSGLQSQEHRCREYARSKGYEVEKVFLDSSSGGGDFMKRPGMVELLSYIDKKIHKNYVVIFDDLKRFARDTEFHFKLKSTFLARDVKLECLNYRFDDSPEGTFVETIFAAQGQLEKDQNKRQVTQKMKARLEDGYWPFFPPPGYKSQKVAGHGKLLMPYDLEAKIITEAFEGFASNRFQTVVDLTKFLISKGFSLNNGKNHVQRTIDLLRRPIYAGYIEYLPWEVSRREGKHKPLISKECFAKIEAKLNGNIKNKARKDISKDFPLRNFVSCAECGKLLTASWSTGRKEKHPYYRCTSNGCINKDKSIRRDDIERELLSILEKAVPKIELLEYTKAKLNLKWQKTLNNIQALKEGILREMQSYRDSIKSMAQQIPKTRSEYVIKALQDEIDSLAQKEKESMGKLHDISHTDLNFGTALDLIFEVLKNPCAEWQKGDLDHRRLLLGMVFEGNIPYDRKNGFGTAILQLPSKVFCQNSDTNSLDVEMGGIEPPCK